METAASPAQNQRLDSVTSLRNKSLQASVSCRRAGVCEVTSSHSIIITSVVWTHSRSPAEQRGAGQPTYLAQVGDGQVHACQLLPHRLGQIQTQRASCPDRDAQQHSCRHGKAEHITHRSNHQPSPCRGTYQTNEACLTLEPRRVTDGKRS